MLFPFSAAKIERIGELRKGLFLKGGRSFPKREGKIPAGDVLRRGDSVDRR